MKILIIEDEAILAENIEKYLHKERYICERAGSYGAAMDKVMIYEYDCILLDITLPGGSGLKILDWLKKHHKSEGVIIISAKDSITDKVAGLTLGADDYLTKPFHLSELTARIMALIRRRKFEGTREVTSGNLLIDLANKEAWVGSVRMEVTRKELELLLFFIANKEKVVSKEAIAEHLSGDDADMFAHFDFIYSHIKNLKRKLMEAGSNVQITSRYGLGYKLTLIHEAAD